MRKKWTAVVLLAVASLARAADTVPTPQELDQLVQEKKWAEVMSAASRILSVRGGAGDTYDRYDVWMKKGEAQIQSNLFQPASTSFAKAAEEKKATPDQVDDARALALLSKKSDAKGYKTPAKPGPIKVYEIKDPAKRPEALAALFAVESAALGSKVDATKAAVEPKPLIDLAKAIIELKSLDRVVNKSTEKTDTMERTVGDNFVKNATKWSATVDRQLEQLKKAADEQVTESVRDAQGRNFVRQRRRGYMGNDANTALQLMRTAERWADTYKAVQQAFDETGQKAIQPAESVIQGTYDRAKEVQNEAMRPQIR